MTLAQLEERLTALEQIVERLQTQVKDEANALSSSSEEQKEGAGEDLIPGTEYDLVITVPPKESIHLWGEIVSVQAPEKEGDVKL